MSDVMIRENTPNLDDDEVPVGRPSTALWSVIDKNAREMKDGSAVPRVHEIVPGTVYALTFNKPTKMPEEHARRFLKDAAFEVRNAAGEVVAPLGEAELSREVPVALAPDQVIAKLSELNRDALLTRAALLPDAPRFTRTTTREVLIEFITKVNSQIRKEGEERLGDDMSEHEVAAMFGAA